MLATISDYQIINNVTIDNPSSDEAQRIELFLQIASDTIETICQRTFAAEEYEEIYSTYSPTFEIILNQYPIHFVTSITVNDMPYDVDEDTIIYKEDGTLYHPCGFPVGINHIKVEYVAGYETVPTQIVYACCKLAKLLTTKNLSNLKAENLGQYSYVLKTEIENNKELSALIEPFKNYVRQ